MQNTSFTDTDIIFQTLSYATRLLASEKNLDQLVENAVDILSDFGHSNKVEFFSLDDENPGNIILLGQLENGFISQPKAGIPINETNFENMLALRRPEIVKTADRSIIYLPLIGSGNNPIGILVLHVKSHTSFDDIELRSLIILTTLIAVSLEYIQSSRLAMFDSLTGLYIRRQMNLHIEHEIGRIKRYGGRFAVAMLDIDHFKRVNDTYGHLFGDQVLQELAQLIRNTIRQNVDIPCRFGGEEFIIILPQSDVEKASAVTERLRQICEEHEFLYKGKPVPVTFSAGVIEVNTFSTTPKEVISRVDKLLYYAKENGRNRVCKEG
ncbi:MAG: GGDEF domain-containing protein [Candidatus Cloacimonetes bacterium]|nr:GGDEF domain-containing protein [Candidatus Cloacimonadota bacterium]